MSGEMSINAIGQHDDPPHSGSVSNNISTQTSDKESLFDKYRKHKEETKSQETNTAKYLVNNQVKDTPKKDENAPYITALGNYVSQEQYTTPEISIGVTDKVSQFLNDETPSFVFDLLPDDILNNTFNKTMLNNLPIDKAMQELPRRKDGSYDTEKIRADLEYAVNTIKAANNDAIGKMDYGTYKNFINGADIYNLLLGPEISSIAENKGWIEPQRMFSLQDLDIINIASKIGGFELPEGMEFKDSFDIKKTLEDQNKQLDNLLKIDLSNEDGIKKLLSDYTRTTQTGFSCDEIERAREMMESDSDAGKGDKFNQYVKAFGSTENYMDVWKNNLYTGIAYEVIFKLVIPKILKNTVPYGKAFAPFIPAVVETHETLSSGLKDGEIINTDKINTEEAFRVLADGGIHAAVVSDLPLGKFGKGLRGVEGPKSLSQNTITKSTYKTLYRWTRGGAKATTVSGSSQLPAFSGTMFNKNASKWERTGSAIFNAATGYIFLPAGVANHLENKSADLSG